MTSELKLAPDHRPQSGQLPNAVHMASDGANNFGHRVGPHLIVDIYGAARLDDQQFIEETLIEGARSAGATVLSSHFHLFHPNGGVTGVVLLAESHISIHSWPEHAYAALDVFTCGAADPMRAVSVIERHFLPRRMRVTEMSRGQQLLFSDGLRGV